MDKRSSPNLLVKKLNLMRILDRIREKDTEGFDITEALNNLELEIMTIPFERM